MYLVAVDCNGSDDGAFVNSFIRSNYRNRINWTVDDDTPLGLQSESVHPRFVPWKNATSLFGALLFRLRFSADALLLIKCCRFYEISRKPMRHILTVIRS